MSRVGAIALVSVALVLGACGDDDPPEVDAASDTTAAAAATTVPTAALEGTTWTLTPATSLGVELGAVAVTARFEAGTVSGQSGCNRYTGPYTAEGSALTVGPQLAVTSMACPPPESAVEAAYLERLPRVASYAIADTTLTLLDAGGAALLVYESVAGDAAIAGPWEVVNYYTGTAISSVAIGSSLTAEFGPEGVSGDAGCNQFTGPYTISGEAIQIGPLASTRRACVDPAVQTQETAYLAALEASTRFAVTGSQLELFRADGGLAVVLIR